MTTITLDQLQKEIDRLTIENARLKELAYYDYLTTLANRRHFDESLEREWNRSVRSANEGKPYPLALLFVDLDHFKGVVDGLGHDKSNWLLRDIGVALSKIAVRSGDKIARYGGDEIAILLTDCSIMGAERVAQEALESIRSVINPDTNKPMTASIGAASIIPATDIAPTELVNLADKAMYESKRLGRNRVSIAA